MSGAGRRSRSTRDSDRRRRVAGPSAGRAGWGWHQLKPDWAQRLIAAADVRPGQLVVEFGAGTGALTQPLLERGAEVIAVELHPRRAETLRRRLGERYHPRLRVVELDALSFRLPGRPFRVISNPPFGITSALIALLTTRSSRMMRADLVLQHGAVNGYLSDPPTRFTLKRGLRLPPAAFLPPPRVDCAVLIVRRG